MRQRGGRSQLEESAVVKVRWPSSSAAHELLECGIRLMVEPHLLLHVSEHSLRLLAKAVIVAEYRQMTHREPAMQQCARTLYDQSNKNVSNSHETLNPLKPVHMAETRMHWTELLLNMFITSLIQFAAV